MLNKDGVRELAYVVSIDRIEPIQGSDNCEAAIVGGWRVMVRKGTFKAGDLAIYFEIDSKLDTNKPEFAFLEKKHGKIKTQKYTFGGKGLMISQGLLMAAEDFGWKVVTTPVTKYIDTGEGAGSGLKEGAFLTQRLGVTYADAADNKRKANSQDKYKRMASRRPKLFKNPIIRKIYKTKFGKKILFFFFGKKKDQDTAWPSWVAKTDEERVQNMPWILEDKSEWIATEKIDGTSTTFTMRKEHRKYKFYVCSRNVCFSTREDKSCYYGSNVYLEMAEKYDIEKKLREFMDEYNLEWITLQGETYGDGIQKRNYSAPEHAFMGFNLIFSDEGRLNSVRAAALCLEKGIPWVPIVDRHFVMPDTVDELLEIATGESQLDGKEREGLVFRDLEGKRSFKAVSNSFLLKYHG